MVSFVEEVTSYTLSSVIYDIATPIFQNPMIKRYQVSHREKKEILNSDKKYNYIDISEYARDLTVPLLNQQLAKGIDLMFDPNILQIAFNALFKATL